MLRSEGIDFCKTDCLAKNPDFAQNSSMSERA